MVVRIDDLVDAYTSGYHQKSDTLPKATDRDARAVHWAESHQAGIRAVVEALRDDMSPRCTDFAWTGGDLERAFDEILASDGVQKETP
jgi:hypothetical protein